MIAVRLLFCSALAFAEADKGAVGTAPGTVPTEKAAADVAARLAAAAKAASDQVAADKAAAQKAASGRSAADTNAAGKAAADTAAADAAAARLAAAAKVAADQVAAEKAAADKAAAGKAAAEKAAADATAARLAAAAKVAAEQVAADKAAAGKTAAGPVADDTVAARMAAAAKAAADQVAKEKAAADKAAAGKALPEQPAVEKAAAEKAGTTGGELTAAEAAGRKIVSIGIKGNRRIESAAILQAVHLRAGDFFDLDQVDTDLRAIYKLGHFRNVAAETVKSDSGVALYFTVQEKPVVREIKIEGAKEIKPDKIREALEIKPNTIYSSKDLQKSIKKVKKLYADDGYYLAEIEGTTTPRSDTELDLTLKIKEGEKVLIKSINFQGNNAFSKRKLKKQMETSEKWFMSWLTGAGTYKEDALKNDTALLTEFYMNNGYVNVKIGEPKVELLPDKSGLIVNIGITEGEQYRLGQLSFKGDLMVSADDLKKKLTEKSGELFSRANLRTDVFALTDVYADKGYAFANVNPQTRLNPENHTVDIAFDMEKGDLVHIDRVNISGNVKSRDKVVRRELRLDEGDLYSSTALKRSKQNLMNTGFFEEANLVTAKGRTKDQLDLNVEVKEKPTGTFSIGAGYSSLDGIIGQGSVQQANFLGLGLKATAAASFGSKTQTYNVGLTDPYFLDTKWTIGADVYRTERQYLDYTRRATGGDIKAGYPLSDNLSTFWIYKYEQKELFDESQALLQNIHVGIIAAPDPSSTTSSITGSLTHNNTDYRIDPSSGWINTVSIEFAGLGGTNRFLRYITEHSYFMPVGWGTVASVRGTLGYIQGLGKPVPIDEKFYLGGISSLRGYTGRTVGETRTTPHTPLDFLDVGTPTANIVYLGGDTEAVINLEYTFPLLKEAGLKGVVFFDAGNANNGFGNTFSRILSSYGGGIRWFSPIGPLRLEYGVPLNPRPGIDKSSGRIEFSIGSIF